MLIQSGKNHRRHGLEPNGSEQLPEPLFPSVVTPGTLVSGVSQSLRCFWAFQVKLRFINQFLSRRVSVDLFSDFVNSP